jgi:very-long-chain enoyl-CoA reductase
MIFPQWTIGNIILYGYIGFLVLAIAPMELKGMAMMEYSKFHVSKGLTSRQGMLIVYSLPLLALGLAGLPYAGAFTQVQLFVFGAIALSFLKRIFETLIVHKYSGTMSIPTVGLIAGLYSLAAYLVAHAAKVTPLPALDTLFFVGAALYVIGFVSNYVHHKILADLRKDTLDYVIPRGGLFNWVVCAHYLFEIMIWFGIFLMARNFAAFLTVAFIIAYLSARAVRTLQWYRQKFADFPSDRKAIIPFIL